MKRIWIDIKFSEIAQEKWEDKNMIEMLIWLITAAGKEKQRKILERDNVFVKEDISKTELKSNLLELTDLVAESYDEYWEWFFATKIAREFENELIKEILDETDLNSLILDLWCANWKSTNFIASNWFKRVIGLDISAKMIEVAKQNKLDNCDFHECDLSDWIPYNNQSIDLIISNFWAASSVNEDIFREVNRVLKRGWKAFLSFYNKDALVNQWWQPWQSSIEAVMNPNDDIIEVPIIDEHSAKTFKLYAKALSIKNIDEILSGTNLEIQSINSHSLINAMMPPIFFEDENRVKQILEYEKAHSVIKPHLWFYITLTLTKK